MAKATKGKKKSKKPEYGILKGGKVYKKIFTLRDVNGLICEIPEHEVARAIAEIISDKVQFELESLPKGEKMKPCSYCIQED